MAWDKLIERIECQRVMQMAEERSQVGRIEKVNYVYVAYSAKFDFFCMSSENDDSCVAGFYNGRRIF